MLIWMREGTGAGVVKFVLMGLLLMAVVGLMLMDRGGFFRTAMSSRDGAVASGGGVKIDIVTFDRTLRRTLASQGIGPEEAYKLGLVNNVLSSEIQARLFAKASKDLGLEVNDDMVKRQISKLAEPLAGEGRTKKQALQQILRQQSISEPEFITMIRQEMANSLLRAALQPPATLSSPLMAKSLYRYDNEKRVAKLIVLKNDSVPGIVQPTEDQLKKYYESNKMDYLIPESRTITMATLKPEMLKKNVTITDQQLHDEYDHNNASYKKPERRVVEQAVLKTEDEAKKALESMKAGKSMKDSVPAAEYNGEQDYEEAGLLPEIAGPVFEAKKGAILGPIQTSLGWHVILMKDTLPETTIPFDEIKDKLKDELQNSALTDEMYQAGNTIEDRAAAGDKFEDIVKDYGMTTEIIGPFQQNGMDKDHKDLLKDYGTDKAKILQTAYDYEEGEIAPVVETADGQFRVIRIDHVIPDTYRDFNTVKAEVEKRWLNEQRNLANKARAKDALDALNSGKTLDDVAKQTGQSVQTMNNINRKQTSQAPLTPIVTAQIFATDKGKPFSAEIQGAYLIGQVEDIILPPSTVQAPAKELSDLQDLTGRTLAQDILAQYITGLNNGKNIKINQTLLEETYAKPQDQQQTQQ